MDTKKEKLIIDGNAVYELDLECLREKKKKKNENSPCKDCRNMYPPGAQKSGQRS